MPTLRLKLLATTLSGAFMGMAGAPLPYYVTYLDPASGFSLAYAVNGIAMPLIGGTSSWLGPVIGAVLLGDAAAGRDGDDLVGAQPADRRADDGGLRHRGAEGHPGLLFQGGGMRYRQIHTEHWRSSQRKKRFARSASSSP